MLVLCCISLLLLAVRLIYPYFITPGNIIVENLPLIESKSDSLDFQQTNHNENVKATLFTFNPNKVTEEELEKLGLSKRTIQTFLKFRNKGFVFKQKEDLKKVYGISEETYEKLQAYVYIEPVPKKENSIKTSTARTKLINLNTADSVELLGIKGVGPAFAKRIIKYRSLLGGFVNTLQLKEVYGLTPDVFEKIAPQVMTDGSVQKININTDDFKTVNRHPYIGYEITKLIFNQRKKQALTESDLKAIIADESLYSKIQPYISFN
jgi:competence ComEA-like helix-hairpin-helix protein